MVVEDAIHGGMSHSLGDFLCPAPRQASQSVQRGARMRLGQRRRQRPVPSGLPPGRQPPGACAGTSTPRCRETSPRRRRCGCLGAGMPRCWRCRRVQVTHSLPGGVLVAGPDQQVDLFGYRGRFLLRNDQLRIGCHRDHGRISSAGRHRPDGTDGAFIPASETQESRSRASSGKRSDG